MSASDTPTWLRWIGEDVIRRCLTWDIAVDSASKSLSAYSRGSSHPQGAVQPIRTSVQMPEQNGRLLLMPGYVKTEEALATKILSMFPGNAAKGLTTHTAIILLMDPNTGFPLAILGGESITEIRTAAASAVATKLLIRDEVKDGGSTVAILGSGIIARSHARVLHHCIKPKEIRIWSRHPETASALCETLIGEGIPCITSSSVEEAVKNCDVINTCTLARKPILNDAWVSHGAHINSVGAPCPDWQELECELVRRCTVYADSKESALVEAGDIIKSGAEIYAEIGDVINGKSTANRDHTTIFKSLGIAVEDAAAAKFVYDIISKEEQNSN